MKQLTILVFENSPIYFAGIKSFLEKIVEEKIEIHRLMSFPYEEIDYMMPADIVFYNSHPAEPLSHIKRAANQIKSLNAGCKIIVYSSDIHPGILTHIASLPIDGFFLLSDSYAQIKSVCNIVRSSNQKGISTSLMHEYLKRSMEHSLN